MMKTFIHRQVVRLTPEDFHHLVQSRSVIIANGSGSVDANINQRAGFRDDQSKKGVDSLLLGSALILLDTSSLTEGLGLGEAQVLGQGGEPAVVGWKGFHALSIHMHKSEVIQMKEKMDTIVRLRESAGIGGGPVQRPPVSVEIEKAVACANEEKPEASAHEHVAAHPESAQPTPVHHETNTNTEE